MPMRKIAATWALHLTAQCFNATSDKGSIHVPTHNVTWHRVPFCEPFLLRWRRGILRKISREWRTTSSGWPISTRLERAPPVTYTRAREGPVQTIVPHNPRSRRPDRAATLGIITWVPTVHGESPRWEGEGEETEGGSDDDMVAVATSPASRPMAPGRRERRIETPPPHRWCKNPGAHDSRPMSFSKSGSLEGRG